MSLISWNFLVLGTPWASQFLKEIVLQKSPNYIFLCETIYKDEVVDRVRRFLGFEGMFSVAANG